MPIALSPALDPLYPAALLLSTAAFYGMARSELAHNGVLHSLLSDEDIGRDVFGALLHRSTWPSGAPTGALARAEYQAPGGKRGRIDELVHLDDSTALIIEMKVDSLGGARQLADYMAARKDAHGLLLRLTSVPDPNPGPDIGRMDLAAWCLALADIAPLITRSKRITMAQFAEYRALCETLRRQEQVIIEQPTAVLALANDRDAAGWWRSNGRWCLSVMAGCIASHLAKADSARRGAWEPFHWLGPKIDTDNTGGRTAFVDCAVGLGSVFYADPAGPLVDPGPSEPLAVGFLKIRVSPSGVAPEVHVIKRGYKPGKTEPSDAERAAMDRLCARAHAAADTDTWTPCGPPRAGAGSGKVLEWARALRLEDDLSSVARDIGDAVVDLSLALVRAVSKAGELPTGRR